MFGRACACLAWTCRFALNQALMWQVILALLLFRLGVLIGSAIFMRWAYRSNENDEDGEDTIWFDPLEWVMATRLFRPKQLTLTDARRKRSEP